MFNLEAFQEFREGITRLRDGDPAGALIRLRRASELAPLNAYYLSYQGLALAQAEHNWDEAERLCSAALRMKRRQPQLYLNLFEVYLLAGQRQRAAEVLSRGLRFARRDFRLGLALEKLAMRRSPVFHALPRQHFLNRHLGKLRHVALQYLAEF